MAGTAERPNAVPWPPIILILSIVVGALLGIYVPIGWPGGEGADILQGAGVVVILVAVGLGIAALYTLRKSNTTFRGDRAADHLVTNGPFAMTRNPIYLSNVILLIGLGLFFGNGWLLIAAIVSGYADGKLAIEREEAHLDTRFGKPWREYRKRVRRWI